jgi:hypothetical protein
MRRVIAPKVPRESRGDVVAVDVVSSEEASKESSRRSRKRVDRVDSGPESGVDSGRRKPVCHCGRHDCRCH